MFDILYFLTGGFLSAKQKINDGIKTNKRMNDSLSNGSHIYYDANGRLKYDNMFVCRRNINGHDCLVSINDDETYGMVIEDYYVGSETERINNIVENKKISMACLEQDRVDSLTENKPFGYYSEYSINYDKRGELGYNYYEKESRREYRIVHCYKKMNSMFYIGSMCKEYKDGEVVVFVDDGFKNWVLEPLKWNGVDTLYVYINEIKYNQNFIEQDFNKFHEFNYEPYLPGGKVPICSNGSFRYGTQHPRGIDLSTIPEYKITFDDDDIIKYYKKLKGFNGDAYSYNGVLNPIYYYKENETGNNYFLVDKGFIRHIGYGDFGKLYVIRPYEVESSYERYYKTKNSSTQNFMEFFTKKNYVEKYNIKFSEKEILLNRLLCKSMLKIYDNNEVHIFYNCDRNIFEKTNGNIKYRNRKYDSCFTFDVDKLSNYKFIIKNPEQLDDCFKELLDGDFINICC